MNKEEELQKILEKISNEVLIPNWFLKSHIEEIIGKKISNKKFKEFIEFVKESSIPDEISENIRVWYSDFENEE
jgi:hypothetical protein